MRDQEYVKFGIGCEGARGRERKERGGKEGEEGGMLRENGRMEERDLV